MWHIIIPQETTNLCTNPSAERSLTGWAGTDNGTISRVSGVSAYGAWSVAGTINANGAGLIAGGTLDITTSGTYTYSAWVYGGSGSQYRLGIRGVTGGAAFAGSIAITTGGTWHRYAGTVALSAGTPRFLSLVRSSGGNAPIYVDAVQVELGTLTTYVDGDRPEGTWLSTPHASMSARSGDDRRGGVVAPLRNLGLTVLEHDGIGMPPIAVERSMYGALDGAVVERVRVDARPFVVTTLFAGTTYAGLHALRNTFINTIKIDLTRREQPIRFLYSGAGGTLSIDAIYESGLQMNDRRGFAQTAAIRFIAADPYWRSLREYGTTLPPRTWLGSVNFIARQDGVTGQWGTLGVNGITVQGSPDGQTFIRCFVEQNGTLWFGGRFGTVGGTAFGAHNAGNLAMYVHPGRFGTPVGGSVGTGIDLSFVRILLSRNGTLYLGGDMARVRGTVTKGIAFYANHQYGTLSGGTVDGFIFTLALMQSGTLWVGGAFNSVAGTTARSLAYHVNGTWYGVTGSFDGPFININAMTFARSGTLYLVGGFTGASGTYMTSYANGTFYRTLDGLDAPGGNVNALYELPNGHIVVGGRFTRDNRLSVQGTGILAWTGYTYRSFSRGFEQLPNSPVQFIGTSRNMLTVYGFFGRTARSVPVPAFYAHWTGGGWVSGDLVIAVGTSTVAALFAFTGIELPNGDHYIGGNFYGSGYAPRVIPVVNSGQANAYPRITMHNPTTTPTRIYQLRNYATDDGIWFDYILAPSETVTLTLEPGSASLVSSLRGNVISAVVPGSNLATWKLKPGTNYIAFLADNDGLETTLTYHARAWSADQALI